MSADITISIDRHRLRSYSDGFLAVAWHVAQANPAAIADPDAGELAEDVGREIVRRWLQTVEPELWAHQGHYYSGELRKLARYVPPTGCRPSDDAFYRGRWVVREQAAAESVDLPSGDEPSHVRRLPEATG